MISSGVYWLAVAALIGAAVFLLFIRPRQRRRKLARMPLPAHWQRWLQDAVPHYQCLPTPLRRQLAQHVKVIVAEKAFYGCDGLEITERQRVTIAAQASLLLIDRSFDEFSAVQAILLYPSAFRVPAAESSERLWLNELGPWGGDEVDIVSGRGDIHLGESWQEGRVILSWTDIEMEIARRQAGLPVEASVVVHEFAHQLDQQEGLSAAMAVADSGPGQILARAYDALQQAVERDEDSLIDPYGATNPEEFLAVATETFFNEPVGLRACEPGLYQVLRQLYRVDLAALVSDQGAGQATQTNASGVIKAP